MLSCAQVQSGAGGGGTTGNLYFNGGTLQASSGATGLGLNTDFIQSNAGTINLSTSNPAGPRSTATATTLR